jgi:hypothetical protein
LWTVFVDSKSVGNIARTQGFGQLCGVDTMSAANPLQLLYVNVNPFFFAVAHFIFLAPISLQRGAAELWKFLIAQLVQMGLAQRSSFFCLEVQMVQSSCGLTSL